MGRCPSTWCQAQPGFVQPGFLVRRVQSLPAGQYRMYYGPAALRFHYRAAVPLSYPAPLAHSTRSPAQAEAAAADRGGSGPPANRGRSRTAAASAQRRLVVHLVVQYPAEHRRAAHSIRRCPAAARAVRAAAAAGTVAAVPGAAGTAEAAPAAVLGRTRAAATWAAARRWRRTVPTGRRRRRGQPHPATRCIGCPRTSVRPRGWVGCAAARCPGCSFPRQASVPA